MSFMVCQVKTALSFAHWPPQLQTTRYYVGILPGEDCWGWVKGREKAWEFPTYAEAVRQSVLYPCDGEVVVEPFHGDERTATGEFSDRTPGA